ncbi:MAG: DUF4012 domain-containing protein [Parcubacteria group bacterium]|nr:DUF4012 domain-containing protein [Parcubacteria group bacterium]
MKQVLKNIFILIASLLVLGIIIYTAQVITNLRFKNNNWLKAIANNKQISFSDLNNLLDDLGLGYSSNNAFQQKWLDFIVLLPKLKTDVELQQKLTNLEPVVNDIQNGGLMFKIINGDDNALSSLKELANTLSLLEKYDLKVVKNLNYQVSNWLSFLGETETKNYLLLFQEPKISRPSGGMLGDYGILTFENGKSNLQGDIIFDLDDLLIKKIIPPLPLQFISNKWFFHDVNWFFDFPTTAKKVMEFYQETSLKPEINGVIIINDSVVSSILSITGPIKLSEYEQTIDANNFSSFFDQQILEGAQATSEQREIFSVFINELFLKLKHLSTKDYQQLQNILLTSLNNKDIQLFSDDDQVEYFFDSLNWAGKITESHQDYLAVVFNNLDENLKIDTRIKNVSLETKISTSTITNVLIIKSPALERNDFNRETYLKIYLPKGVKIIKATGGYFKGVNNDWPFEKLNYQFDPDINTIESRQIIDSTNSLSIFEESSKTVIGTWAKLSAQSFTLTYELPFSPLNLNQWNLIVQKQSGQNIKFSYNLVPSLGGKLAPTLFEFNKSIPLYQDLDLNFGLE